LVVVAFELVEFEAVKFCKVVEPSERILEKVPNPDKFISPPPAVVK
jgi:hypothetical protein